MDAAAKLAAYVDSMKEQHASQGTLGGTALADSEDSMGTPVHNGKETGQSCEYKLLSKMEMSKRESGGIGRRARLRIWSRKGWGFESPLSHQPFFSMRCRLRQADARVAQ